MLHKNTASICFQMDIVFTAEDKQCEIEVATTGPAAETAQPPPPPHLIRWSTHSPPFSIEIRLSSMLPGPRFSPQNLPVLFVLIHVSSLDFKISVLVTITPSRTTPPIRSFNTFSPPSRITPGFIASPHSSLLSLCSTLL
jgi:hypothetical protein